MNPLSLKYPYFKNERSKKYIKSFLRHIPTGIVLLGFFILILQPDKFQVQASETTQDTELVQEIYHEMLANSQQENHDGAIQFETLLVGEDGETKISYTVSPGDNLSKIAKLFGTTVSAITKANNINNEYHLRVGTKLTIAYDKSIIHDIEKEISVEDFARKYNLDMEDLLTLNYLEDGHDILVKDQQIFVPLNKVEAEERGLIKKKPFVMLNLPSKPNGREQIALNNNIILGTLSGEKKVKEIPPQDPVNVSGSDTLVLQNNYEQKIISAEETAEYLQELKQAEKEAEIAKKKAEELQRQAEEAQKLAEMKEEKERVEAKKLAAEKAEQARLAQIEAEKKAQLLKEAQAAEQKRWEEEKKRQQERAEEQTRLAQQEEEKRLADLAASCGTNKCYHEGKCRSKPEHALCAPNDDDNARTCKQWFVDTGRSCISQQEQDKKVAQATAPKKKAWVLKQRYFNPYKEWYNSGRWGGHCTHYAGYYRSSKLGKETNWRGNAKLWYTNASAAGREVWSTPTINSIIVMKYGSQWWNGYGHVGIVIDIDRASRQVLIEDMNYVGRYIVSQHRVDLDSTKNPVIGFVYPVRK